MYARSGEGGIIMWELYERLIEPIPDDVPVDEIIVGTSCTMVRAGGAAGAFFFPSLIHI